MIKKILTVFILGLLILGNITECFARGSSGGGRSSSFSSSRSSYSSFSSSRSIASSISKPSKSWSFSRPSTVVKPRPSIRVSSLNKPNVRPIVNSSRQVKVVTPRTVIKTKVIHRDVHHYNGGSSMTDFITTALFLDMLSDNSNKGNTETLKAEITKNINNMKINALKCYDAKGGRSCIEAYVR